MTIENRCPICGGEGTFYDDDAGCDCPCGWCSTEAADYARTQADGRAWEWETIEPAETE
jgi:organic radical activating enzyme